MIRGKETRMPHIACLLLGHGLFFLVSFRGFHKEGQSMSDFHGRTYSLACPLNRQVSKSKSTPLLVPRWKICFSKMVSLVLAPRGNITSERDQFPCEAAAARTKRELVGPDLRARAHLVRQPFLCKWFFVCDQWLWYLWTFWNILGSTLRPTWYPGMISFNNIDHFGHTNKSTEQDKITHFRKPLPSWKSTTTNISKEACTCISTIGECIVSGWIRDAWLSHPISHRMLWSRPWPCCLILNPHSCPSLLDLNIRLQSAMRCICICICIWARNSSTP